MLRKIMVGALIAALAMSTAWAQGGPGNPSPMGFGPANSPGWNLMTPQERAEHRSRMLGFTTYEDCAAYLTQHHKVMLARAKAKGVAMPERPRMGLCRRLKATSGSN